MPLPDDAQEFQVGAEPSECTHGPAGIDAACQCGEAAFRVHFVGGHHDSHCGKPRLQSVCHGPYPGPARVFQVGQRWRLSAPLSPLLMRRCGLDLSAEIPRLCYF